MKRTTGGLKEFVDNDSLHSLENKLGRSAPRMGTKKTIEPEEKKNIFRKILNWLNWR